MEEEKVESQFDKYVKSWTEALNKQLEAAGASRECPFCKTSKWSVVGGADENGEVMGMGVPFFSGNNVKGYFPALTLSCGGCGFVAQHLLKSRSKA